MTPKETFNFLLQFLIMTVLIYTYLAGVWTGKFEAMWREIVMVNLF